MPVSSSRGVLGYVCGVAAGALSVCILNFSLTHADTLAVLGVYIAAVPLFITGFSAGVLSCGIAGLVGVAVLIAMGAPEYAAFYAVIDAVPAFALIFLALRARLCREGDLLTALAVYPCLIFIAIYAVAMGHDGGLLAMTTQAFDGMPDLFIKLLKFCRVNITPEIVVMVHQYVNASFFIAPALAMFAWLFSTIVDMAIAQGIAQQQKWNLRPPFALANVHIPVWIIFAAAATGLAAVFAPAPLDYVGMNLALIIGVPFFFTGLAVIHAWAAQTRRPTMTLVAFYILISVIIHLVLLVALLGAVDQWVDFRKRFSTRPKT